MSQNKSTHVGGSHPAVDQVSDVTKKAQEAIVDTATKTMETAQAVAGTAVDTIDHNRRTAARVLAHAASTIRGNAIGLPGGEGVTRLADSAAERIAATATYVRQHTTHQMLADLKHRVKRHPGASVLIAAAV